jgi:CheY-like chemotaxis protein
VDGVEATRRIRSGAGGGAQTPIIALTANADPADAADYRRAGMNGVVEKPIRPESLLTAMVAVLDARALEALPAARVA